MASTLLKLNFKFAYDGEPLVGNTVLVSGAGSNVPAALFASSDPNTKRFQTNKLVTGADGTISVYVKQGMYRLTLLSVDGSVLVVQDNVAPVADNYRMDQIMSDAQFVDLDYASTMTPYLTGDHTVVRLAPATGLTGSPTVAAPAGNVAEQAGKFLTVMATQDAPGGRAITWNAAYVKAADSGSAGATKGATTFVCDGAKWIQIGNALTFR